MLAPVMSEHKREPAMKIYLFCPETGIYQGEDFADAPPMVEGRDVVPEWATTIAPPSCGEGEVPVFLPGERRWEVRRGGIPSLEGEGVL